MEEAQASLADGNTWQGWRLSAPLAAGLCGRDGGGAIVDRLVEYVARVEDDLTGEVLCGGCG